MYLQNAYDVVFLCVQIACVEKDSNVIAQDVCDMDV
jgi:hypothetical protein